MTVIDAVPLCPSLVAVIVAGPPTATAVTSPEVVTVATVESPDAHVIGRPTRESPLASMRVAWSWTVRPTKRVATGGDTRTAATGTCCGPVLSPPQPTEAKVAKTMKRNLCEITSLAAGKT